MDDTNFLSFERIPMEHVRSKKPLYENTQNLALNIKFLLACRAFGPDITTIVDIPDTYYRPLGLDQNSPTIDWTADKTYAVRENFNRLMKGDRAGPREREVELLKCAFDNLFPEFKGRVTKQQLALDDVASIIRHMAEVKTPNIWTLQDPVLVLRALAYMYPPIDITSAKILTGSDLANRATGQQRFPVTTSEEVVRYSEPDTTVLHSGDNYEVMFSGPSVPPIVLETSARMVETAAHSNLRALKLDAIQDRGRSNWVARIEPDRVLQASDLIGTFDIHIIAGLSSPPPLLTGTRMISDADLSAWVSELRERKLAGESEISLTYLSYIVKA